MSEPELVCPACGSALDHGPPLRCRGCERRYPVVAGIPDLRLRGDRYLDLERDRDRAEELAALEGATFADLVAEYWRTATPAVPAPRAATYTRAVLDGVRRASRHLDQLPPVGTGASALDVGCGTGGGVLAMAERGMRATGVDIALRWLVVARRRLEEAGADARLVAADGAALPFPAGTFDIVTAVEVLEHAEDQRRLLHSTLDAAAAGGVAYVVTANRHSLVPDPVVGLWLVGYLPRRHAVRYVEQRRGLRYDYYRPLSAEELRGLLGPRPGASVTAGVLPAPPSRASTARRLADHAHRRLRSTGAGRRVLSATGPFLEVLAAGRPPV